jgi:hypothetical protein
MSDIVERLYGWTSPMKAHHGATYALAAEAAAEIERLTDELQDTQSRTITMRGELHAEIKRLQALLEAKTTPGYEFLAGELEKRDAEIERLRRENGDLLKLRDGLVELLRAVNPCCK